MKRDEPLYRFLKIFLLLWLPFVLFGCNPLNATVSGTPPGTGEAIPTAVSEAINRLSQGLNISIEDIEVVEFEHVEWPDACLGFSLEGQSCAQVVTPGFRVFLKVNDQPYEFRTNEDGTVVLEVPEVSTPIP